MRISRSSWAALLMVSALLILWQLLVTLFKVPVYLLPAPTAIMHTLVENGLMYAQGSLMTFGQALVGLLIGMTVSFLIAASLSFFPTLEGGIMTLAILVKSTPMVAIAPLLTIWLGFGVLPKIVVTALLTFFPALVNLIIGFNRVDPALIDLFRSWGLPRRAIFRHLRLPSAIAYLFAALKICAPLALIGSVVAEWTGASGGLGRIMWLAYTNLNLPYLFGAIFILSLGGILIYWVIDHFEKKTLFWLQEPMSE